ncbi:pyridoxamine 5'-phosphate oxidase family protein [Ceratobasidium sp. AG-Ba]|nr:pyridoxamine 5'-phosphate oxidase family protein [Ceratobasidium sp. AG-Ba]
MSPPRWLTQLLDALSKVDQAPAFAFSTVDTDGEAPVPRVRHHLHRGVLTSNPARPLIITTTDIRSSKIHQIRSHPNTKGPTAEVAWWLPASGFQFRITVRSHILPSPSHEIHSQFPTDILSGSDEVNVGPDAPGDSAEWERFRLKTFNSIPGFIRASFARPTPGSPLSNPDDARKWPQELPPSGEERTDEERKLVREALKNFAVLALEPVELDVVEFGKPDRRTRWNITGKEWKDQSVVP